MRKWTSRLSGGPARRQGPAYFRPALEPLEGRWCPADYTWNPAHMGLNLLANNGFNWKDSTGNYGTLPTANDTVHFDFGTDNSQIEWNATMSVKTMDLHAGYVNTQTIDNDVSVNVKGGITLTGGGAPGLTLSFSNTGSKFVLDGGGTTNLGSNFAFGGVQGKFVVTDGAILQLSPGANTSVTCDIDVTSPPNTNSELDISPGGAPATQKIAFQGNAGIQIEPNSKLGVIGGVDGITLVTAGAGGYLWVQQGTGSNHGTAHFTAPAGTTTTWAMPIRNSGVCEFSGTNDVSAGVFKVSGSAVATNGESIYNYGGTVQLDKFVNLYAINGYYGDDLVQGGTTYQDALVSSDGRQNTLTLAADGKGSATFAGSGGGITVGGSGVYGSLVIAGDVVLHEQVNVWIDSDHTGTRSYLQVSGKLTLDTGSALNTTVDGSQGFGSWTVVICTTRVNDWDKLPQFPLLYHGGWDQGGNGTNFVVSH